MDIKLIGKRSIYGLESPSYKKIEQVYRAAEVSCELFPRSHDGIDSAALLCANANILHPTPYRSFTTGITDECIARKASHLIGKSVATLPLTFGKHYAFADFRF